MRLGRDLMAPQWTSQRFPPEGGPTGEGISQQLGRPLLDPLTVLVREAAQNSWDARRDPTLTVHFSLDLRRLGTWTDAWRSTFLPGPHLDPDRGAEPLEHSLHPDSYLLIVSDRNTRGLGGPLRADERAPDGVVANFVQFIRNVGEPSDHEHGGGTYGYGKGILYGLSASNAIVVDTHTVDGMGCPRRLMASALGHSYFDEDTRFTGRHWWGIPADSVTNPLADAEASATAALLGLPGMSEDEFGTDIAIAAFDLGRIAIGEGEWRDRTPMEAADMLASSILWHLWPKMGSDCRPPQMTFSVKLDGREIPVPEPSSVPALNPFVRALDALAQGQASQYRRTVAPRFAGELLLVDCIANPVTSNDPSVHEAARPIDPPWRHVVRMRVPELVVDYFECTARPDSVLGYAGVFRATPEADRIFATSEPPTHDSWIEHGLTGAHLGVVRGSRAFINSQVKERFFASSQNAGAAATGLGALAASLGSLISATSGLGAQPNGQRGGGSGSGGGTGRSRRPRIVEAPSVQFIEGSPYVVARVAVPASAEETLIEAIPYVAVDGGSRETTPPLGMGQPSVVGWVRSDRAQEVTGTRLAVSASGADSDWYLYLEFLPDAVVGVDLREVDDD